MYNGIKEDKQKMLDKMCEAIMEMRANGSKEYNHIIKLQLFIRNEQETNHFGHIFLPGEYVRVIWSNDPDRDDGYYDIYVDGDSAYGMFDDVWKYVKRHIG